MTKLTKLEMLKPGSLSLNYTTEGEASSSGRPSGLTEKFTFPTLEGSYTGNLLVAMPQMNDKRFHRAVIYLCVHTSEGAMGIIINRLAGGISYGSLLTELGIDTLPNKCDRPVFLGGPVEPTRGFILHTTDHLEEDTLLIGDLGENKPEQPFIIGNIHPKLALTATTDMLLAIHQGKGPKSNLLALGYAGWGPGQLESEIQTNSWLPVSADEEIIFGGDVASKWKRALGKLGIDPTKLSSDIGRA